MKDARPVVASRAEDGRAAQTLLVAGAADVFVTGKILLVVVFFLIGIKLGLQFLPEDQVVTLVRDGAVGVHGWQRLFVYSWPLFEI